MSIRSVAEIQADITNARAHRTAILTGAQEYQLDTGQTRQVVKRANLTELNRTIRELEAELGAAEAAARGDSGIVAMRFRRHG